MTDKTQMTKDVWIYQLRDELGGVDSYCVDDPSESIRIGGRTADGKYHQYDSYEGYYLAGWVAERKLPFKVTVHKITVSIPETDWEQVPCQQNQ